MRPPPPIQVQKASLRLVSWLRALHRSNSNTSSANSDDALDSPGGAGWVQTVACACVRPRCDCLACLCPRRDCLGGPSRKCPCVYRCVDWGVSVCVPMRTVSWKRANEHACEEEGERQRDGQRQESGQR